MPNDAIDFITQPVTDNVCDLCVHTYGCRVIQRVLENCAEKKTTPILDNILQDIHNLTKD
jgi:pumilio RNA-binding family